MSTAKADVANLARLVAHDLKIAQAKLSDLQEALASLNVEEPKRSEQACPDCHVRVRGKTVAEHRFDAHGVEPSV